MLLELNEEGKIYYFVAKLQDFFIDYETSKKLGNDFIELYHFPLYLVFKSVYPLTMTFFKLL